MKKNGRGKVDKKIKEIEKDVKKVKKRIFKVIVGITPSLLIIGFIVFTIFLWMNLFFWGMDCPG